MELGGIEERDLEASQGQTRTERDLTPILHLRGKERMEAILSSQDPKALFQSLPEEEAYFTIKEIGEQDALSLLSLMSPAQCQFLLDLELWKGYELQVEKIEHWLPLLLACEGEAIERWLRSIDLDTLLLLLKKTIRVHLKGEGEWSPSQDEAKAYFTLDGTYYIEVLSAYLHEPIEHLLKSVAHLDFNLYVKVLHQANWEIPAELEERTFHFREARLEDKGFPPMEEALSLYQYLNPKRLERMLEQKEIYLPGLPNETVPPSFPMVLRDQSLFFSLCLRELEEGPLVDRLKMELSYMANQVLVVEQPEEVSLSVLLGSLRKVGGFLSIGLEVLTEGDIRRAREYIERVPLKYIFQVGFGTALELKWRAERVWRESKFLEKRIPFSFLGSPWGERIEGLLKKRPLFYEEGPERGFREFRSLEEIRSLRRDLDRVELLGKILSSLPSFSYSDGLLWTTVLLSAYDQEQWRLSSLETRLRSIEGLRRERFTIEDSFKHWLYQKIVPQTDHEREMLQELASRVLDEMAFSS